MLREEQLEEMERKNRTAMCSVAPKASVANRRENVQHDRRSNGGSRQQRDPFSYGRRLAPQKSSGVYKCPTPRSDNCDNQKEEEVADVFGTGIGQIATGPRPRKSNFNHLLNFTYVSSRSLYTAPETYHYHRGHFQYRRKGTPYNKEQFLQANCQFAVKAGKDYSVHAADPDVMVSWDLIEEVYLYGHEVPSCPICLYAPVAAKITRCGHIYCWSCILHYMSLDERSWSKCPICYDSIHQKDLKSVALRRRRLASKGDEIVMRLMKREKGCMYAMPCTNANTDAPSMPPPMTDKNRADYSKLVMANIGDIQKMIADEEAALRDQLSEEGLDTLESSFIESALHLLKEREAGLLCEQVKEMSLTNKVEDNGATAASLSEEECLQSEHDAISEAGSEAPCDGSVPVNEYAASGVGDIAMADDAKEREAVEDAVAELVMPAKDNSRKEHALAEKSTSAHYYFYQAADGQHVYLHAINARCLLDKYGAWENCPTTISAPVVYMEGFSMTEEMRRRLRYLSHLPLTCEFQVAELDLQPPLISRAILDKYADQIERKSRMREKKQREEKRKLQKMQDEENKRMGIFPAMKATVLSMHHFPSVSSSESVTEIGTATPRTASSNASAENTPFGSPMNAHLAEGSISFAKVLQKESQTVLVEEWPKTVKRTPQHHVSGKPRAKDSDSEADEGVRAPSYRESLGDAIQTALETYKHTNDNGDEEGGKKAKKSKQKKTLLFSTSMMRNK